MEKQAGKNRIGRGMSEAAPLFSTLFQYLYCMMASTVLFSRPAPGGALFLVSQTADYAVRVFGHGGRLSLTGWRRTAVYALILLSLVSAAALITIYPRAAGIRGMRPLAALVMLVALRRRVRRRLEASRFWRGLTSVQRGLRLTELGLLFMLPAAVLLFLSLESKRDAAYLLVGFGLTGLRGGSFPEKEHTGGAPDEDALKRKAGALAAFRRLLFLTVMALELTMILVFTYLAAASAERMLWVISAALAWMAAVSWITGRLLRRRGGDPANVLPLGLCLWLLSLALFWLYVRGAPAFTEWAALAAVSAGAAAVSSTFGDLTRWMEVIARFAAGDEAEAVLRGMPDAPEEASFFAQMLALIGLSWSLFISPQGKLNPEIVFRPLMLWPAVAVAAVAAVAAARFPISKRHMEKLHTFFLLKENGETNLSLQKQLEDAVIKVRNRKYGVRLLMAALRPFLHIRIFGQEKVKAPPGSAMVFVCNHGEIYGPIAAAIYLPFPVRPWVTSEMMTAEETTDYIYNGTFKRQKWLPESMKMPLARALTPVIHYAMEGVGALPVYRNHPASLIRTFRQTVAAMQAGDHILVFPENPVDENGRVVPYMKEGVGEFFSGFTAVAPLYVKRTGKACAFVPVYADKKRRALLFGEPVLYDMGRDEQDGGEALRGEIRRRMTALSQAKEE